MWCIINFLVNGGQWGVGLVVVGSCSCRMEIGLVVVGSCSCRMDAIAKSLIFHSTTTTLNYNYFPRSCSSGKKSISSVCASFAAVRKEKFTSCRSTSLHFQLHRLRLTDPAALRSSLCSQEALHFRNEISCVEEVIRISYP